jgi:hypothetical protein
MKIKWGALVVDGRGKIGGHVASKNRSGAYLRTKVTPDNPQSTNQMLRRSQLAGLSSSWGELTEQQRNAWIGAVDEFPSNNVFGDSVKPTGKNLYVGLNLNLLHISQPIIETPPAPGEVIEMEGFEIGVQSAGGLTIDLSAPLENPVKVFATPVLRPGVNFVKNKYRFIGVLAKGASDKVLLETMYADRFGSPKVGDKIGLKFIAVNDETGQAGAGVQWLDVLDTMV